MKRRILLVDDDLAVLLTLKAVLEINGFEVETAGSSAEAFARIDAGVYHMVISDLRMETDEAGLEVIRAARRKSYAPATALLTAFPPSSPPSDDGWGTKPRDGEDWAGENSASLLIKPLGIADLVRQVEALLISHADKSHADKQLQTKTSASKAQETKRQAG